MPHASNVLVKRFKMPCFAAAAVAVIAVAAFVAPVPASASAQARGIAPEVLEKHEVKDAVSPRGIHIDLHDYWLAGEKQEDHRNPDGYRSMGVNRAEGDQKQLIFGKDVRGGINGWTGSSRPFAGIVQPVLGPDGYPHLAEGNQHLPNNEKDLTVPQSLKYLFDGSDFDGKRSHLDTSGLLRLDAEGYYYYDSQKNFATYNEDSNSFTLYDAGGVVGGGHDKQVGQFFPFNTAKQVFKGEVNGKLKTEMLSTHAWLRHYFGLTMSANFMQPEGGRTKSGKDMLFEFAGDDDVWVFIDGVLVGDVGGVHDRTGLSINFATGEVYTYDGSLGGNPDTHYNPTTIREMFRRALGDSFDPGQFQGDTFSDGTYHTLQFYYLERGNANSNLALKFNLVTVAESTMTKVDQLGKPVEGAQFDLFATDGTYAVPEQAVPVATGSTDRLGGFSFKGADGKPLSFMKLYHQEGIAHYVLRETKAPAGYRKSPDGKLKFVMSDVEKTLGFLFSDNYWESGVFAHPEQELTIEGDTVRAASGVPGASGTVDYPVDGGTVFAVIYRQVAGDARNPWRAMSGSTAKGWKASEKTPASVEDLRDAQIYVFEDADRDGKYQLDMRDMPGNPERYYMMSGNAAEAEYAVGFYYTKNDAQGSFDPRHISKDNTVRLDGSQFSRQTAANLYVTDTRQLLGVQKVDDNGMPVNGARFGLYAAGSMVDEGGALAPAPNAKPVDEGVTEDQKADYIVEGKGLCYLGPLDPGVYYLVELAAPEGYVKSEKAVRVLVDARGVHVDTGAAGDGVRAMVSMGSLVDSMTEFAAKDDTDMTLHDVIASCRTARSEDVRVASDGSVEIDWSKDPDRGDDIWLAHGAPHSVLDYGPDASGNGPAQTYGMVAYTIDEGLAMCGVRQNGAYGPGGDHEDPDRYGIARWENLGDRDVTALYTGATCAIVENRRVASLAVTKRVQVSEGMVGPVEPDGMGGQVSALDLQQFTVRFELTNDGAPLSGPYAIALYEQTAEGRVRVDDGNQTLQLDASGAGETTIADGQTLEVYGLPDGCAYRVSEPEDKMPSGFTQQAAEGAEGAVVAGETQNAQFTNVYRAEPALLSGKTAFPVEKEFENWGVAPSFAFTMSGASGAPMPEGAHDGVARLELTAPASGTSARGCFGDIAFTLPGSYAYYIQEERPVSGVPGVTYSDALYLVTVTVVENAEAGRLEATSSMRMLRDDAGEPAASRPGPGPARFVNTLSAQQVGFAPMAHKEYVDHVGSRPLRDDMFTFVVEVSAGSPIPTPDGTPQKAPEDMTFELGNKGQVIQAGQAIFTQEDLGKTYYYTFYEKLPAAAEVFPHVAGGVTYDPVRYRALVEVGLEGEGDEARVKLDVKYFKLEGEELGEQVERPVFHNEFDAQPATARVEGLKVLSGREFLERDAFVFSLAAADAATAEAIDGGTVALGPAGADGAPLKRLECQVSGAGPQAGGHERAFAFEGIRFNRVGTYRFAVEEVLPDGENGTIDGLTYDRHTALATVKVEEDPASASGDPGLRAVVSYENGGASAADDRAVFTNTYRAFCTSEDVSLTVSKSMDGRPLKAGDFAFRIEGLSPEAQAKLLNASDRRFVNAKPGEGQVAIMEGKLPDLLFTQDDVGKIFAYEIREELPAGVDAASPSLAGVVYDMSRFVMEVEPVDKGDGSMGVVAQVLRTCEADGTPCEPTLLGSFDGSGDERPSVAFANSYHAASVTVADGWAAFAKRLEGRPWTEDDAFAFEMERVSYRESPDAPAQDRGPQFDAMPLPARVEVGAGNPAYGEDGASRVFSFGEMTFSAPGEYVYRVREVVPSDEDAEPGMTYDDGTATVTVRVVDAGTGRLVAYVDIAGAGEDELIEFVNEYAPAPGPDPDPGEPGPGPTPDPDPEGPEGPDDPGCETPPGGGQDGPAGPGGEKPGAPGGSGDKLIQTGDSSLLGIAAAAVTGALILGVGIAKRRKSE